MLLLIDVINLFLIGSWHRNGFLFLKFFLCFSFPSFFFFCFLIRSFLIGNDGVVYEGTGWRVAGAHTYGYNANGTGIAFIGNYSGKHDAT